MDNNAFVADNFDTLMTLHRKERTLLGDMRLAFKDNNIQEFTNLLHRTGYKNDLQTDKVKISNNLWSRLKLQTFKTSRNLLFEHSDDKDSLFEEILSKQGAGNSKFFNVIWTECELWRKRDILITPNSKGLLPIDYVIKSNDDENLFAFLVFDFEHESETVAKLGKNYFLKLKNMQYIQKTGESLFQKFYSIIDEECEDIIYDIMNKLFKEMRYIIDIKGETAIDDVLKMENEQYKHKILKLLMTHWKVYSKEYNHYKKILSDLSPYYKLILTLKEKHEYEFEEFFPQYLELMKTTHGEGNYEEKVRSDCNSLLEFALNNVQRRAISTIIDCPLIDPNKVTIKLSETSAYDTHCVHYIMSKLLEKGFYMGNSDEEKHIPLDWISPQVFEEFLDSRVQEDGIYGCQIDYNFLIDPKIRDIKLKGDHDDNGKLLFSRGIKPLENILDNERLKALITHPVLSTFINLKARKFRVIFNMNFYVFLLFYIVPFFMLLTLIPFRKFYIDVFEYLGEPTKVKNKTVYRIFGLTLAQFLNWPYRICIATTIYLTIRECLQLFFICDTFASYFKKKSNQFEVVIIALSWYVLYGIKNYSVAEIRTYLTVPSAVIIILGTIDLLTILPYPSMSIYMIMLEQVTRTFLKFFTIFFVIIVAFTFTFCVAFRPPTVSKKVLSPWKQLENDWKAYANSSTNNTFKEFVDPAIMLVNTMEDALTDNGTIFRNFENPFQSFQKTLMMLSGEYTIDPYTLDTASKQGLFLFFVITSFILFNLINGLAISDIAQLKEHAEFLNLKHQIRNAGESEDVVCDIYWKVSGDGKSKDKWWRKWSKYFISMLIRKYPYLHKMDNLCIDFKQKIVKYELDQKRTNILRTRNGALGKYTLDNETMKKFRLMLEERANKEESVNEKVENLQSEVKKLKTTLRVQHEEMRKLIQECLQQPQEKKS
ncbi:hypothetical protein PVAND_009747 [Polypedilum vanderplanki]|uniref:Ion transport domain-containing protein n=1 Tax=Polypedilum vanderplanki TaxID=319348 RepID=A0A9J6CEH8_POLVA|nr:hypothetical protein PVAND_009747 [Polypedilum vanderplanki]